MIQNHLRIILIALVAGSGPAWAQTQPQVVRRLATTARLAADEYRLGVSGGRVVLPAEVDEAKLFLTEARKAAAALPAGLADSTATRLDRIIALIATTADPDSVGSSVERLVVSLGQRLGVTLDEVPAEAPSLARGGEIYRSSCQSCHGIRGGGDGLAARGLEPAPTRLADSMLLADSSPLDFYRRVTIGVAGTAMPSYESTLSSDDRWAVALYASTLRLPSPSGSPAARWRDFALTAQMSDAALRDSLGGGLSRVATVRMTTAGASHRATFVTVRRRLDSALALAREGKAEAARGAALDAYMAFEVVERTLRVKDAALVQRLEAGFARTREETGRPAELVAARAELELALARAERTVGASLSPLSLFVQSFILLVREGIEAILVIGALLTFLVKVGAAHRKREIHWGVISAIGLSLLTAVGIETVFRLSPAHQEALEAVTMVLAAGTLFFVSYWLLSKMEVARWSKFVKSRMASALTNRSALALASVAFLAVYREGFETVLFYKALALSGGHHAVALPIGWGIGAGTLVLSAVNFAINRFGIRLPLKPFFAVTGAFLYFMAFSFAGTAIAELQEGGFAPMTPIRWLPRLPLLGLYPTVEGILVQAALLGLAVVALVWTLVVAPRRGGARAALA
jgi:high-affinity iron transporter